MGAKFNLPSSSLPPSLSGSPNLTRCSPTEKPAAIVVAVAILVRELLRYPAALNTCHGQSSFSSSPLRSGCGRRRRSPHGHTHAHTHRSPFGRTKWVSHGAANLHTREPCFSRIRKTYIVSKRSVFFARCHIGEGTFFTPARADHSILLPLLFRPLYIVTENRPRPEDNNRGGDASFSWEPPTVARWEDHRMQCVSASWSYLCTVCGQI